MALVKEQVPLHLHFVSLSELGIRMTGDREGQPLPSRD